MSAPSPIATKREKPMPRRLAQSSTAAPSAPDCDTKAVLPGTAPICVKLAFSRAAGDSKPRLPGPRMPETPGGPAGGAQPLPLGRRQHRLLDAAAASGLDLAQPRRHDDGGAGAARAQLRDQAGYGGRRRA